MSGHIARKGFYFQDLYLLLRVLTAASDTLDASWKSGTSNVLDALGQLPLRFGLEASPPALKGGHMDSPDWDVLVLSESRFEFAEVKSGAVTKDDRLAFWRRLRRELSRDLPAKALFVPILVVDPDKLDPLGKWMSLAQVATAFSALPPTQEPTGNVHTAKNLLQEALWCLCRPDNSVAASSPPVEFTAAINALSRFELHRHEAQKLESQVSQFVELLFPGGLTDTQEMLFLGWLSKRATSCGEARRLFSIRELLQEVGILQDAISLKPGTLKEWRNLWNEVPLVFCRRND